MKQLLLAFFLFPLFGLAQIRISPLQQIVRVEDFGAIGDGVTNDAAAFQAAINSIPILEGTGGQVNCTSGKTYLINTSVTFRVQASYVHNDIILDCRGSWIKTTAAISVLARNPVSDDSANWSAANNIQIRNIHFQGDGDAGQKAIDIGGCYNCVFEGLEFRDFDTAFECQYCLMSPLRNSVIYAPVTTGASFTTGEVKWSGTATFASNHARMENVECSAAATTDDCFVNVGGNGVVFDGLILEGGNPIRGIRYNSNGNSSEFTVKNLHVEIDPSDAVIDLTGTGHVSVEGFSCTSTAVCVDSNSSNNGMEIGVTNVPFFNAGTVWLKSAFVGPTWSFNRIGSTNEFDPANTAYWSGGTVPYYWTTVRTNGDGSMVLDARNTLIGNKGFTAPTLTSTTSTTSPLYKTTTNCADSAGAAACGAAPAGSVVIDAGATTVVVSTTAVTANSQIFVQEDSGLGARLGVTCNTTPQLNTVSARTAATSFTITTAVTPAVNPRCYGYVIVN